MERLQRTTGARYIVEVVWEYQFDKNILPRNPELKQHFILQHVPLNTRDVLYGVELSLCFVTSRNVRERQYSIAM